MIWTVISCWHKRYVAPRLKSSLQILNSCHYDPVDRYEISISQTAMDLSLLPNCFLYFINDKTFFLYAQMSIRDVERRRGREFESHSYVLVTTLCYKICQCLATGHWFSPGTPVSSTNTTDHHDITEILLKVALNTITLTLPSPSPYWSLAWAWLFLDWASSLKQ